MYVAIGLVVVFVLLVLRCYVCKPNKNTEDENVGPAKSKSGAGHDCKPAKSGVLSRMARGVYASLPMASPPATPQRTGRQSPALAGRPNGAPSRGSGDDGHSTDDEDYDIESCRSSPRRGRGLAARTPPCTPGTPTVTVGSSPYRAVSRDRSATTRTVVIMHDVVNPDGSVTKQATHVELPLYETGFSSSTPTGSRPKVPQNRKAFPKLTGLPPHTPCCGVTSRAESAPTSKPPSKWLSAASADGTDIASVSSLSGSASTPRAQWRVQGQSPPRQQAPQYQQRTPSPQQHLQLQHTSLKPPPPSLPSGQSTTPVRPVVHDGIASPGSEPPTPINSVEKKRTAKAATSPTKRPPTGSPQRARREMSAPAENYGSGVGVLPEALLEAGWTIHIHRSGRTFYHNNRCVCHPQCNIERVPNL
jgi:hypothetical protein